MRIKHNSNVDYSLEIAIRMSLQRALLNEISSNLRMVAVDWNNKEKKIVIYFYFDREVSEENRDSANCVAGEVTGDFDPQTEITENCIQLNSPLELPNHQCTVYRRRE